jgi:hypothetical protein
MGDTWENRQVIAEGAMPMIAADMDTVYVAYWSLVDGEIPVLQLASSSDGDTWSTPVDVGIVQDFTDSSCIHALAASMGHVFVAYGDYNSSTEAYTVRINCSDDGGTTWEDMGNVTGTSANTLIPCMSIEGSMLHFTWLDVGSGSWYSEATTYYRSVQFMEEPIPEFGDILMPVVGVVSVFLILTIASRKGAA